MMYNRGFLKRQTVTQIVGLSLLGLFLAQRGWLRRNNHIVEQGRV